MATSRKAAGICYRRTPEGSLEFLLVRNSAGTQWVFPKGTVEPHEAYGYLAAARESWEEAGARGRVDARALGSFRHAARSKKTNEVNIQIVTAYAMEVSDTTGTPEPGRNPTWFNFSAAEAALLERKNFSDVAKEAVQMLHLLVARLQPSPTA